MPLVGKKSIAALNGSEWQKVRRMLAPAFSAQSLSHHIPALVDDTSIFIEILHGHTKVGDIFSMEDTVARLIFNVAVWTFL